MAKIESGVQLFARLSSRPSLENLNPEIFPNGGLNPKDVIEIVGDASTGKTLLVIDTIARCLLPHTFEGLILNGKDSGTILINTDHHFSILKLISVMETIVKSARKNTKKPGSKQIEVLIKERLRSLIVLNCYDSQQLCMTFHKLENILSENMHVSLVVLDGLASYFWFDRPVSGIRSMGVYQHKIIKNLLNAIKNDNVVLMYTKPAYFQTRKIYESSANNRYKIILENVGSKYVARVHHINNVTDKFYEINKTIKWLSDAVE